MSFHDLGCGGKRLGGTANLAVLGGNLPPSFVSEVLRINWWQQGAPSAVGESPAATGQWPVPPAF